MLNIVTKKVKVYKDTAQENRLLFSVELSTTIEPATPIFIPGYNWCISSKNNKLCIDYNGKLRNFEMWQTTTAKILARYYNKAEIKAIIKAILEVIGNRKISEK